MKNNHVHIASDIAPILNGIGWTLQQSSSIYNKSWWQFNKKLYRDHDYNQEIDFANPWDSSQLTPNLQHVKQRYTDITESENLFSTDDLDEWVSKLEHSTVFGMGHGGWNKMVKWRPDNVTNIYFCKTDTIINYMYNFYGNKSILNMDGALESIKWHVHDHKQNNRKRFEHLCDVILPKFAKQGARGKFWQFQYTYHVDKNYFPSLDEENIIRSKYFNRCYTINDLESKFVLSTNPVIVEDPLDIDLENLCKKIDLVYNYKMQAEYDRFVGFVKHYAL